MAVTAVLKPNKGKKSSCSYLPAEEKPAIASLPKRLTKNNNIYDPRAVSYTHLTLPTMMSV